MSELSDFRIINGIIYEYLVKEPSVVIPEGVYAIGDNAFEKHNEIVSVTIPEGCEHIGHSAFFHCNGLKTIKLPKGLVSLGCYAFWGCNSIEEIEIESFPVVPVYQKRFINWFDGGKVDPIKNATTINRFIDITLLCRTYAHGKAKLHPQLEKIVKSYMKNSKFKLIEAAIAADDDVFLGGIFEGIQRIDLFRLDDLIKKAEGKANTCAWLMEYKHAHFSDEKVEMHEQDKMDKAIGIKEYSLADYRRDFSTSVRDGGIVITGIKTREPSVTIPERIGEYKVIGFDMKTTSNDYTEDIICLCDIRKIPMNTFSSFRKLRSISFSSAITDIGAGAFSGCRSLLEIRIPDSVTRIGDTAFCHCSSLTDISIPEGVVEIGSYAFHGCEALTDVKIGASLTRIGSYVFSECGQLRSITLPKGIEEIPVGAFQDCSSLTEVNMQGKIKKIGEWAFSNCSALGSFVIPDSVKEIGSSAFGYCNNLSELVIPDSVTQAHSAIVDYDMTKLVASPKIIRKMYKSHGLTNSYWMFQNVRSENYPFFDLLREDLTQKRSFREHIVLDLVRKNDVANLRKLLPLIEVYDYNNLTALINTASSRNYTEIVAMLQELKSRLFTQEYINRMEEERLRMEAGLQDYSYDEWRSRCAFSYNDEYVIIRKWYGQEEDLVIPAVIYGRKTYAIGRYAFKDQENMRSVVIPEGVVSIGKHAFENCSALERVELPESLHWVDSYAFANCDKLDMELPEHIERGKYPFWSDDYFYYEYGPREDDYHDLDRCRRIEEMFDKRNDETCNSPVQECGNLTIDVSGKIFVHTGLSEIDEDYVHQVVENGGGVVKSSVVLKTDYLIYNPDYDHETVKMARAKELIGQGKSIELITIEDFRRMVK